MCPGRGLLIDASGVTLDCAGHTIEAAGSRVVEVNSGLSDVTVMNCVMIKTTGSDALRARGGTTNILFTGNDITHSGSIFARAIRFDGTSFSEISNNNVLSGNIVHTTGTGAPGVLLRPGADDNIVERNVLRTDNTQPVRFESASGNVFDENTLVSATGWLVSRRFALTTGGLSVHPDGRIFAVENLFGGGDTGNVNTLFEV